MINFLLPYSLTEMLYRGTDDVAEPCLSETVFDEETQVEYKNVFQIFPEEILNDSMKNLREFIKDWKEDQLRPPFRFKQQIVMLRNEGVDGYTTVEFGKDHKLVSPETFLNRLTHDNDDFYCRLNIERLRTIAKDIMKIALERFALERELVGTHSIRLQLKSFNYYVPELKNPMTADFDLGWHHDFCADATLAIPLPLNDFTQDAPGELLFARNGYKGICSGLRGDNIRQSIPIESTITKVPYPEKGGLLFEGQRGAQIHRPCPITIPANDTPTILTKMLIQVASFDVEWMHNKFQIQ